MKNTGTATWVKEGARRTGLNALNFYKPVTVDSRLADRTWMAPWRPVRMKEATVKPGQTAHFAFVVAAPKKTGLYHQTFAAAHGATSLIPGTNFRIAVASGQKFSMADLFRGRRLEDNPALAAGEGDQTLTLSFKNTGRWIWESTGPTAVSLKASNHALIPTKGWIDGNTPAQLTSPIKPGQTASFTFPLPSPLLPGQYHPTFTLYAGPMPIAGTATTVPIGSGVTITEPTMRVGLFSTTTAQRVTANTDVTVADGLGHVLGTLPAGVEITDTFDFTTHTHTATWSGKSVNAASDLRLVGPSASTVLVVTSYTRSGCSGKCNFNDFRNTLEFHYAPVRGELWVVNELPLEWYIKGIGEGSNTMSPEYLKTLATAARSYAFWHLNKNTKRADWGVTLLSSAADQVYMGYTWELVAPNHAAAVETTRGIMVFHPGAIKDNNPYGVALTAYSACTDGRTRSYSERFGGDQSQWPWLVSVPDPDGICVNPAYLKGEGGNHMVGMSGNGAIEMGKHGKPFDQILTYYYAGVTVGKLY